LETIKESNEKLKEKKTLQASSAKGGKRGCMHNACSERGGKKEELRAEEVNE